MPTTRGLTTLQGAALYIGAVLGTGVLVLPGLADDIAGPAAVLSWLFMIVLSIPLATTFASLGARFPDSGGVAHYVARAVGPTAGEATGGCFYVGVLLGTPSAAVMGGYYVSDAFTSSSTSAVAPAIALYVVAAVATVCGVRTGARIQLGVATLIVIMLLVVLISAWPQTNRAVLSPFLPNGLWSVGKAASLLMFAFVGWEAISPLSSAFTNPQFSIPRATAAALCVTSALYLAIALVVASSPNTSGDASSFLIALSAPSLGAFAGPVIAALAGLLTVGALIAYISGAVHIGTSLLSAHITQGHRNWQPTTARKVSFITTFATAAFLFAALQQSPPLFDVLLHGACACFAAVYLAGSVAGYQLAKRPVLRLAAVFAALLSCVLLAFSGVYVAVPVICATAAGCSRSVVK